MNKTTVFECDIVYSMTIQELGQSLAVDESLLIEFLEHGLLESTRYRVADQIQPEGIQRMKKAVRLAQDLGMNAPGVVLAIELMEQMQHLQNQLWQLRESSRDE